MQWRFGFSSTDEVCQIGTGVMDEVWRGRWWTLPFLLLGSWRRVLFPSRGATCRSRSPTTRTSTASGADRHLEPSVPIPGKDAGVRRDDDPERAARHDRRLSGLTPASRRRHPLPCRRARGRCASAAANSASTNGHWRSATHRCSRAWPTCGSGGTTTSAASASRSASPTASSARCSGTRGTFDVEERPCPAADVPSDVRPRREQSWE